MPDIPASHPETPEKARGVVEDRRETVLEAYKSENDFIQGLAKNYDRDVKRDLDTPAQVIPELLQNADDVEECRAVEIHLSDDELCIRNNGRPLFENEFRALCHIGESTKQEPGYIGHFGRGFKSVFSVTDNPQIRSGYFRFQFHRDRCVLPEHLNSGTDPEEITYGSGTEIRLPLKGLSEHDQGQLEGQIDEIQRLLPYLRHITEIFVNNRGNQTHYRREKTDRGSLTEVEIYRDGSVTDRRHIFSVERVPPSDEFDELVDHRDLENVEAFRDEPVPIQLSVPVDTDGNPVSTEDAGRLVNFFPTRRELDCSFDIQADFLLDSDRTDLKNTDGPYNSWIFEQVGDAYEKAVDHYLNQNPPSDAFLDILPTRVELEPYLGQVREDMIGILRRRPCIPSQSGEWHSPDEIIVPKDDLKTYLSENDLEQILDERVHYSADSLTKKQLESLVRIGLLEEFSVEDLVEKGRGSQIYQEKSLNELLQIVALFNELWEETYKHKSHWKDDRQEFISALKETPLIPVQGGGAVSIENCNTKPVLPPEKQGDEYERFINRVTLVDLSPDTDAVDESDLDAVIEDARSFFEEVLELEVVSEDFVITEVIAPAFRNIAEETDDTLDSYLEFIRESRSRQRTAIKNDAFRFRTKTSGTGESSYRAPERLFIPDEYGLEYSLEALLEDVEGAEFVTAEYLNLNGSKRQWRRFLKEAGVSHRLEVEEQSPSSRKKFKNRTELKSSLESSGDASTTPPEAPIKSGSSYSQWLNGYRYALSDYLISGTFERVLEIIQKEKSESSARHLAHLLSEEWEYYSNRATRTLYYANRRGKGNPYRADEKETNCPSSFIKAVRETPWCPTKAGMLRPPSTLLVESPQTQGQNNERYIDDYLPFSEEIYETIGTRTRLTPEAVLDLLAQAPAVWGDDDPSVIRSEITSQVDQLKAELTNEPEEKRRQILEELREAPFIYVESAPTQFRTPQEIVLQGISLDDRFISISNLYDRHHEFFVEQLDVRERVTLEDCLRFLAEYSGDELSEEHLKAWTEVVRQFVSEMDSLSTEEFQNLGTVKQLTEQAVIPTQTGETAHLSAVDFFCPNKEFLENIMQNICARTIRQPEGSQISQERLTTLWERLGLANLRNEVSLDLVDDPIGPDISGLNPARNDERLTKLLAVCRIYLNKQDDPVDESLEIIEKLADYRLSEHSEIQGHYTLKGTVISDPISIASYIDHQNSRLLKTEDIESYYHLASELAKTFPLASNSQKELQSILTGAVGTETALLWAYLDSQGIRTDDVDGVIKSIDETEAAEADDGEPSQKEPTSETGDGQLTADTPDSQESRKANKAVESVTGEEGAEGASNSQTNGTSEPVSNTRQSAGGASTAASGNRSYSQTSGSTGNTASANQNTGDSTFEPGVSPADLDSRAIIENRPDNISSSGSGSKSGGGGGGGGGQAAEDIGRYGEEFVVAELAAIVREEFSPEQVSWYWDPEFSTIEDQIAAEDLVEPGSKLNSDKYSFSEPGIEIELQDHTIRILHIRDARLGADILIEGLSCNGKSETGRLLTPKEIAPDAETWIEVKSTQNTGAEFPLTIGEYGRAREKGEDYHIIRLCRVGSENMYVDRLLTDLGRLLERNDVKIDADSLQLSY